jgi:hypothetical protein
MLVASPSLCRHSPSQSHAQQVTSSPVRFWRYTCMLLSSPTSYLPALGEAGFLVLRRVLFGLYQTVAHSLAHSLPMRSGELCPGWGGLAGGSWRIHRGYKVLLVRTRSGVLARYCQTGHLPTPQTRYLRHGTTHVVAHVMVQNWTVHFIPNNTYSCTRVYPYVGTYSSRVVIMPSSPNPSALVTESS